MPPRAATGSPIYQLKITLQHTKPPIWRRLQVRASMTLPLLHDTIQVAMGWTDSHLHQFIIGGVEYGLPDPEFGDDMRSEQRVKLERVVTTEKDRFVYEYDFGDSWTHIILLEKILPVDPAVHYPQCLAGKRACPPEDVGGVWGYAEFLEAIRRNRVALRGRDGDEKGAVRWKWSGRRSRRVLGAPSLSRNRTGGGSRQR